MRKYYRKQKIGLSGYILMVVAFILVSLSIFRIKEIFSGYKEKSVLNKTNENEVHDVESENTSIQYYKDSILLVNKENELDEGFVPDDLVELNTDFISNGDLNVNKLTSEAAEALEKMFRDAKKSNVYLLGVSGYRDYNYQKNLYEAEVEVFGEQRASNYVAMPGESEHQTGLAMDVLSKDYQVLDEGFKNTKAYSWLCDNCKDFGFIIRYPEGKEGITGYKYEPWHIRYVGIEVAKEIYEKGITLEEFLNEINEQNSWNVKVFNAPAANFINVGAHQTIY